METKDYNAMSVQEIEDEIVKIQNEMNEQIGRLGDIQSMIRENKIALGLLKDKEFKAEEVIRRTKQDIKNLESVYKWRAIRREKGI